MTSPQSVKNLFYHLVKDNFHLLSPAVASSAKNYLKFEFAYPSREPYCDNYLCLDGTSDNNMASMIREFEQHKNKLKIPTDFNKNGTTLFYNNAEGWCSNDVFYVIEWIIDNYRLTGDCYYTNMTCNNQEMYNRYLQQSGKKRRLKKLFFYNIPFINDKKTYYAEPTVPINEVPLTDKKLYCTFNWNARLHRFGLISYLNHLNLIDHGHITTPAAQNFSHDSLQDYNILVNGTNNFFKEDLEKSSILSKLENLKNRFHTFRIDDRSSVNDKDKLVYDRVLKAPMWEARVNSLFEIIPETFYNGEHMFSEKTFVPIVVKKPFVMISSYKTLESLKKLGIKTFSDFIDETYDSVDDPILRLKMAVNEILKLKVMRDTQPEKFYEMYKSIKEVAEYNYKIFMELSC